MGTSSLVGYKVYAFKGVDIFHLNLEYVFETERLEVLSNIPFSITSKLIILPIDDVDLFPVANRAKVNLVLNYCAKQIFTNPISSYYYYPEFFLKENKIISGVFFEQAKAIELFKANKNSFISVNTNQFVCYYLFLILGNEAYFSLANSIERVDRRTFEKFVDADTLEVANEYVDLYGKLKVFKIYYSSGVEPSFIAALNFKGEILLALVVHSFRI